MALIKAENISLSYENVDVVSDLSFEVNSGDYLCLIGENGSGKSTLVKALLSLKKIDSGKISFGDGLERSMIGYLPQQDNISRDFPASVYEVVLSGCLNAMGLRPFYSSKEKQKALDSMERLGIAELKKRSYSELSGGQQQRVLLARALCATHKLLLLDEPVTGLDPLITQELYELISGINKSGITVIMVTHDLAAAMRYADKILFMGDKQTFFGTRNEFEESNLLDIQR